jgi:phosphatidylglycerophosphate synthase
VSGGPATAAARATGDGPAAVLGVGAGVAAVALAIGLPPAGLAIAAATVAAVAALALRGAAAAHPHPRFGLANTITLVRAGGAAVFAGLLAAPAPAVGWAAAVAAAALLALDGLDGVAARRQGLASAFGARFDMETDALTILVLAALAVALGKVGAWALALGAMRYAFVAAGWVWPRLAGPLPPSLRRKAVCVAQLAVLTALLAPPIAPPVSGALAALALAALAWSFALDVRWLARTQP